MLDAPTPKDMISLAPEIHKQLHERVALPVTAPVRIRHSAYLLPDESHESRVEVREAFNHLLRQMGIDMEAVHWGSRAGQVEKTFPDGNRLNLVWELHTQFYTYTTTLQPPKGAGKKDEEPERPFTLPAFPTLGTKLVDLDIMVVPGVKMTEEHRTFLWGGTIYGGRVIDGAARVWTNFRVDEWGQGRYLVGAGTLKPGRLGRLIRRIVEIENYYHMVLLPSRGYREQVALLREAEQRITKNSEQIANDLAGDEGVSEREHRWVVYLTKELADLIGLTERMRYRLSASSSYWTIIEDRLDWVREETGDGFQSMKEFLTSRVSPAVRNYANFIERADVLTSQLTSLGNMMRTRVNLSMEQQSLKTMQAMNKRVELQLLLQRTVEGLSLIVLSYYLTGLANYAFKALNKLGLVPGDPSSWAAATIPLWFILAFFFTHRVKKKVHALEKKMDKKKTP